MRLNVCYHWPIAAPPAGKYLESAAKGRTSSAISELLRLAPATAILCDTDEEVQRQETCLQGVWVVPVRGWLSRPQPANEEEDWGCAGVVLRELTLAGWLYTRSSHNAITGPFTCNRLLAGASGGRAGGAGRAAAAR